MCECARTPNYTLFWAKNAKKYEKFCIGKPEGIAEPCNSIAIDPRHYGV